jgi:hypothetical protein
MSETGGIEGVVWGMGGTGKVGDVVCSEISGYPGIGGIGKVGVVMG